MDVGNPDWTIESDKNEDWLHSQKTVPTSITGLSWRITPIQWIYYLDEIPRAFCISYRRYSTLSRISRTRFSWNGLDSFQFTPNWPSGDSIFLENPNWIFSINSLQQLMPEKSESSITHLDELPEEECNHIPLNCIWPITSQDTNQTVIITCLKWTFNFAF